MAHRVVSGVVGWFMDSFTVSSIVGWLIELLVVFVEWLMDIY